MNREAINLSIQCLQDGHLYRLRRSSQTITWRQITHQMNNKFATTYTLNDLISRYELISQNFTKEQIAASFDQFQHYDLDFISIARQIESTVYQVKRQIVTVIINNIWKVCFIVRKRKISGLKSNFINNRGIKQLVILMMKPDAHNMVKEEYSLLWKFISKYYSDSHFQTVTDDQYKTIYRELIILAQKFKINPEIEEGELLSFQKYVLSKGVQSNMEVQSTFGQFISLDQYKKKQNQQMINLLSEDECENDSINQLQETQQQQEIQIQSLRLLQEMVITKNRMRILSEEAGRTNKNENYTKELLTQAVKFTLLSLI